MARLNSDSCVTGYLISIPRSSRLSSIHVNIRPVPQPSAGRVAAAVPVVYNAGVPQLSDEQRRRAEAAVAQKFGGGVDGTGLGVGAKLMARMGFGASEGSKGGLGRNEHVRAHSLNSICPWRFIATTVPA